MSGAEYHARLDRLRGAVMVNLAEDAHQLGVPRGFDPVFHQPVKLAARQVQCALVVLLGLVDARDGHEIGDLAGQPKDGRPGDIGRVEHELLAERFGLVIRPGLPAHRHAEGFQVERGHLVDEVTPAVPGHPFMRGSVLGGHTLGHDELARSGPGGHFVIELPLGHVHHRKEDERQGRCPVRQGDYR